MSTLAVSVLPELVAPHRIPEGSLFLENQAYPITLPSLLGFAHDTAYVGSDLGRVQTLVTPWVILSQPSLTPHTCVQS